ncbi:condensation domain-containing protein, partial [Kroppenstedtia guangzhouensis]|uniref:condensation domain-containing protein n=1 Tax=Kroppenstedtia guangzhouensis TaxID=1274356 RepID=UPI001E53E586
MNEHFFEVGGHSLKAMVLTARIHKELGKEVPLSEVFARPTIREMAAWMDDQEQRVSSEIQPVGEREHYPVSAAQRRMYTVQQLEGGASGVHYNMPQAWKLRGALDENRLEESLRELIRRHESLRTSFTFRGGELVQVIHREPEWELERYPVTEEERLPERIASFVRPFDLGKAPLFRAALIPLETEGHLMVWDLHHIISDGVSM